MNTRPSQDLKKKVLICDEIIWVKQAIEVIHKLYIDNQWNRLETRAKYKDQKCILK